MSSYAALSVARAASPIRHPTRPGEVAADTSPLQASLPSRRYPAARPERLLGPFSLKTRSSHRCYRDAWHGHSYPVSFASSLSAPRTPGQRDRSACKVFAISHCRRASSEAVSMISTTAEGGSGAIAAERRYPSMDSGLNIASSSRERTCVRKAVRRRRGRQTLDSRQGGAPRHRAVDNAPGDRRCGTRTAVRLL